MPDSQAPPDPTPGLTKLRGLCRQLDGLLTDAHPGLPTWRMALHRLLKEMDQFSGDPDPRYADLTPGKEADDADDARHPLV